MSPDKQRSIFDLSIDELEVVINSNQLPEGVGLQGIEEHKDFSKLFKHRLNPKFIAEALVKERVPKEALMKGPAEPVEMRQQRIELKRVELDLKKKRGEALTFTQQQIYKRLQAIEDGNSVIIAGVNNLNNKLTQLLEALEAQTNTP